MAIVCSSDGNQLGWTCSYCLNPEPPAWMPANEGVLDALNRMERVHFAHEHTPAGRRDEVLAADEIDPALVRQAIYDVAVKATEREQQVAKRVLGITTEEPQHG